MKIDEFLKWSQTVEGRFELHNGFIHRMQAELRDHSLVKRNVERALGDAIDMAGLDCRSLPDGPTVAIDDDQGFIPDASVECGPHEGRGLYNENPVIVVEIISPSSKGTDYGHKFRLYFRNSKVMHYVIVEPEDRTVTHYRRVGENVEVSIGAKRILEFDPPGFAVDTETFFPPRR